MGAPTAHVTTAKDVRETEVRLRGVLDVKLPDCATRKLRQISIIAEDSRVLMASCKDRLDKIQSHEHQGHKIDAEEASALRESMDKHRERHANATQLEANCREFIKKAQQNGQTLEPYVRAGRVRLLPEGRTAPQMVAEHRENIEAMKLAIAGVNRMPPSIEDQTEKLERYVDALLAKGRPLVRFINGEPRIIFGDTAELSAISNDRLLAAAIFMSGADRDTVVHRLVELIPPLVGVPTISAAEKKKQLDTLHGRLLQAERDEEALVGRLIEDGTPILRRVDASPLAVLGLQYARRKEQAA
jgi:hypothetical protein